MKRLIGTAIAFAFFGFFVLAYLALAARFERNTRAPEQPTGFSHKIHAGRLGLQCLFCHETADKAAFAGVPAAEKCMSCHKNVATDRPGVRELAGYYERGETIEWNRVYRIRARNYVYFSHEWHVKAKVDCARCHGEVKYMDTIRRVRSLEMGWCVQCHRENSASTDCLTCHK